MTNPLFDLTGRSALVTGAAAAVVVGGVDVGADSAVAQGFCADGNKVDSVALDVRDRQAAAHAALAERREPLFTGRWAVPGSSQTEKMHA